MAEKSASFDPQIIATTCMRVVESTIQQMCNLTFSQSPQSVPRDIIEYDSRMRIFGMEIFNGPCYISVVNYYLTPKHLEDHDACGAFVLYLEEKVAGQLLKALFKGFDDDEESVMLDTCGQFCHILGENFKNEISKQGYLDLSMSAPQNYRNNCPEGVEFHYDEYIKYETSFYFWKEKAMAVDITLSPVPEK